MKKERIDYFAYFAAIAGIACDQAELLNNVVKKYKEKDLQKNINTMHALEHEADLKKNEMMAILIKDFLPPIDREDIMSLAELYDSVCDSIDDILLKFYMYNIKKCRKDIEEITDKIKLICTHLKDLSESLRNLKATDILREKVITVNDTEEIGDKLYLEAKRTLFSEKSTSKELIAWNDIYSGLEDCFDSCERVADEVRNVIIKNS